MVKRTSTEWEQFLGEQIRAIRLRQNMTQVELAERAGISRSALASLEQGKGGNLKTFVSALDVLGERAWLESLAPAVSISPLQIVDLGKQRQRARRQVSPVKRPPQRRDSSV